MPQQQEQDIAQAAAVPVRTDPATGRLQVLLIRRHESEEWGIPKGHVDPGFTPAEAAAVEAREEAGVEGVLSDKPIGSFTYEKVGGSFLVQVYALRVRRTLQHWDEEAERERQWFDASDAARRVGREAVGRMIARLAVKMEDR